MSASLSRGDSPGTTAQWRCRYDLVVKYDVIVIGAGASGATIAARVSEDPHISVLLLEAGPYYPTTEQITGDLLNSHNNALRAAQLGLHGRSERDGPRVRAAGRGVADAAVMPKCPRANIHQTSVMIGERAGEWPREGAT